MLAWFVAMLGVATYCIVQSVRDVQRKAYVMATLGVLAAGAVLLLPPPTGPISVTLPVAARR